MKSIKLANGLFTISNAGLISFLEPIARDSRVDYPWSLRPFQHGELPQSSYDRSGTQCVRSFIWLRGFTVVLLNSRDHKSLAHRGWYIYVSFPAVSGFQGFTCLFNSGISRLDGNSLLPSTMNGMSSGDVAPTDGQYGSVPFFWVSSIVTGTTRVTHNGELILSCYRFTPSRASLPLRP